MKNRLHQLYFNKIHCGDCLEVMQELPDNFVDTIITDPPYGLSSTKVSDKITNAFKVSFNIMFPNFHKDNSKRVKYTDFISELGKSSNLGRLEVFPIIKPFISVPKSSIDFNCSVQIRNKEIKASTILSSFNISDGVLMNKIDASGAKYIGNYVLDFGDSVDFTSSNIFSGNFGELTSGGFSMPISAILSSCFPHQQGSFPFLFRGTGINEIVWLSDDTGGNALLPGFVLTGGRAEDQLVLTFDCSRGTDKSFATVTTDTSDRFRNFVCPKLVRTFATTSSLSTKFEPCRVSFIIDSTDGANSIYYFHLYLPINLLTSIRRIPEKSSGFMGKKWDYEIPSIEIWKEALRVAKPGALLLCFGGTRTFHRITCYIEDAGWEIRDCLSWLYGSGFPKSLDISKAIDKAAGAERQVVGVNKSAIRKNSEGNHQSGQVGNFGLKAKGTGVITAPATSEAEAWSGYGTALKPAWEPIIVAMKPLEGTYAQNALKHGVAGLNIDGGRIKISESDNIHAKNPHTKGGFGHGNAAIYGDSSGADNYDLKKGRFPANIILDEDAAALLDEQSGVVSYGNKKGGYTYDTKEYNVEGFVKSCKPKAPSNFGDSGGASRFFYCAKVSKSERNKGCKNNNHPTVKPISLLKYLATLTKTPTGGVILDPFIGSGSTGIAAKLTGRNFIGIERENEYCEIAEARLKAYRKPLRRR